MIPKTAAGWLLAIGALSWTAAFAVPPTKPAENTAKQATRRDQQTKVLNFPADHSLGTLKFWEVIPELAPCPARGRIVVPKRARVELVMNYATSLDMAPLLNLPPESIADLTLSWLEFKDEQLKFVAHFTGLRKLRMKETDVSDRGLQYLSKMNNLDEIDLSSTLVTDKGMSTLSALPTLTGVFLNNTNVGDEGVRELAKLKSLQNLALLKTHVTDEGLKSVATMSQLLDLDVGFNRTITDVGISYICHLPKLNMLRIENSKVTGKSIKYLAKMPALASVLYSRNNFTDEDLRQLRQILPHCHFADHEQNKNNPNELFKPLH